MKASSVVVGVVMAGAMALGGGSSASANIPSRIDDPPVQVQTAAGTNLTVGVSVAVPQGQAKYINSVGVQATTAPDGAGGTMITVQVTVPATISTAQVTAGMKKYKVSSSATVAGGSATTLYLDVPTS